MIIVLLVSISLQLSNDEHHFMCLLANCLSSLEKCLFRSNAHFFNWVIFFFILSCMSCLYILEINPLYVASFTNILYKLSFHFVYGLFYCAKAFKFNLGPFVHFCFYFPYPRRCGSKKILLQFMSKSVLPMFFSRSFIVPSLTFMFLIHFEVFFFLYMVLENVIISFFYI